MQAPFSVLPTLWTELPSLLKGVCYGLPLNEIKLSLSPEIFKEEIRTWNGINCTCFIFNYLVLFPFNWIVGLTSLQAIYVASFK